MTEREKMLCGKLYDTSDNELASRRDLVHAWCLTYNQTFDTKKEERQSLLKKIIPNMGEGCYIQGPFYCDYGDNIYLGKNFYANFNFAVLDCAKVVIGDNVMIGPNVSILTPIHPLLPNQRNFRVHSDGSLYNIEYSKPVTICENCWIAGGVTICGGVTIGSGCVIGAGSVVTRDIPPGSLAVGNPCKVVRQLSEKDKLDFSDYE